MEQVPEIERVSLAALSLGFLRFWWAILLSAVVGAALALFFITRSEPVYQARMIVGPQANLATGGRGASGGGGGLGSLLTGLSAASSGDIAKVEIMLKSDRLARLIWNDKALLREIFPGNWNPATQSWRPRNSGLVPWLLSLINVQLPPEPTPDDVQTRLTAKLVIKPDQQVYRNFTLTAPNARQAEDVLRKVVILADRTLREDDRGRLDKMIAYTEDRLKGATVQAQVQALTGLLLTLEQQRMLAMSSTYYTFDLIQDAQADNYPTAPRPLVMLASGLVIPPFLVIVAILLLMPRGQRRFGSAD